MAGDAELIWHEFHKRLSVFIARRVRNQADVEDILQDVLRRVHQRVGTLKRADRLVSWLFQITRNAVADYYREPARRREIPTDFTSETKAEMRAVHPNTEMDLAAPGMDQATVIAGLSACLRPMTQHLPARYRDALTQVDLEGVTQREAATRHGISISGMKSRVQRGRQILKRMLEECCQIHLGPAGGIDDYTTRDPSCVHCSAVKQERVINASPRNGLTSRSSGPGARAARPPAAERGR